MLFCKLGKLLLTDKNQPGSGGEATSELQMQKTDANVSALMAFLSKLQQEKNQLQKEKLELLAELAAVKGAALRLWSFG